MIKIFFLYLIINIRDNIKKIISNPRYQKLIQKAFPKSKKLGEWQLQNPEAKLDIVQGESCGMDGNCE